MNKKLNKKTWLVIAGGVCVAIWLLVANSVMAYFFVEEGSRAQEADFDDVPQKDKVIISFKKIEYVEDLWDSCIIKAGAFCETDKAHDNRVTEIWLKSEKRAYRIPATSAARGDVHSEYLGIYKMPNTTVGFNSGFSTINIANDIYDIYIYVWENEDAYGISNSGYQLIKNGSAISIEKKNESEEVKKIFNLMEDGRFIGALDNKTIKKDGSLYLKGWGLYLDDTSEEYDSYIALGEEETIRGVYLAERQPRKDISDAYNSSNKMNGFSAVIPSEEIDYQYDTIYLVQKVGSEVYYYLLEENIEKKVIRNFALESSTQFVGAIDELLYDSTGSVIIRGWGTDPQCDWTEYNAYIGCVLDSKIVCLVEAKRGLRPDICEAFAIDDQKTGFYANIPAEKVPDKYDQIVLIKEKDGECRYYHVEERKEDIIEQKYSLTKEHDFRGAIDSFVKADDGSACISGWGVDLKKTISDYSMYILLIDGKEVKTVVSAERTERQDISDAYALQDKKTGFYANIPVNSLPEKYDSIVLAIETADDISYYKLEEK